MFRHDGIDPEKFKYSHSEGMIRTIVEDDQEKNHTRLVCIYYGKEEVTGDNSKSGFPYYVPQGNNARETFNTEQFGAYSDDAGETWRTMLSIDISPFQGMVAEASSQIIELEDGTFVTSFRGIITEEELDAGVSSVGIIRSTNKGESWNSAGSGSE